jgi:Flp pilus assembly pilin Flp
LKTLLTRLVSEEKGQNITEYALLAAAISVLAIPTAPTIGSTINTVFRGIDTATQGIPFPGGGGF